jgi:hypothetical protein
MKKLLLLISLLFVVEFGFSQVFSGSMEIDNNKREGAYILSTLDQKFVDRLWQAKLAVLGKQNISKGAITIIGAKFDSLSSDPFNLYSKVSKQKDRTQVFLSVIMANGDIVTNGHEKWPVVEGYLIGFQNQLSLEDAVRTAENEQNTAMENHKKIIKTGDKLKDKIEDNKKEKEKLLKKIEENRIELEKLLTDIETNKKDQTKALDEIEVKKKGVEEAKSKLPK